MVGWHHWLYEFEPAPGVGDGQGILACCSPPLFVGSQRVGHNSNWAERKDMTQFVSFFFFLLSFDLLLTTSWKVYSSLAKTSKGGTLHPPSGVYVRNFLWPFLYLNKTLLYQSSWVIKAGPRSRSYIFFGDRESDIVHSKLSLACLFLMTNNFEHPFKFSGALGFLFQCSVHASFAHFLQSFSSWSEDLPASASYWYLNLRHCV